MQVHLTLYRNHKAPFSLEENLEMFSMVFRDVTSIQTAGEGLGFDLVHPDDIAEMEKFWTVAWPRPLAGTTKGGRVRFFVPMTTILEMFIS